MRLLAFSDSHIHPWPAFGRTNEDGMQSRLADTLRALRMVRDLAEGECVDAVLFAGDLFHSPRLDAETLALAADTLALFATLPCPVLAVEGNHDQASRVRGLTSAGALRVPRNWRWLRGESVEVRGMTVWGTPYGWAEPPEEVPDVALVHRGVVGAALSEDFASAFEADLRPGDAGAWARRLVVAGHYHRAQVFAPEGTDARPETGSRIGRSALLHHAAPSTPILVPGAPLQHTWGDEGQDRGAWTVDMTGEGISFLFHPFADLPRFICVTEENIGALDAAAGNFVSVELGVPLPREDADALAAHLRERARAFSIRAAAPGVERPADDRLRVDPAAGLEPSVREYAARYGGERAAALGELGVALLRGVAS